MEGLKSIPMMMNLFSCPKCDGNEDNLNKLFDSKGSLHLIIDNLIAFDIKAIYHEKHRIKLAFKVGREETILIFALFLIAGLDNNLTNKLNKPCTPTSTASH